MFFVYHFDQFPALSPRPTRSPGAVGQRLRAPAIPIVRWTLAAVPSCSYAANERRCLPMAGQAAVRAQPTAPRQQPLAHKSPRPNGTTMLQPDQHRCSTSPPEYNTRDIQLKGYIKPGVLTKCTLQPGERSQFILGTNLFTRSHFGSRNSCFSGPVRSANRGPSRSCYTSVSLIFMPVSAKKNLTVMQF